MSDAIASQIEAIAEERLSSRPQAIPTASNAPLEIQYGGKARLLPHSVDDLEADLGLEVYRRMDAEPAIASSDFILRALVLSSGWALGNAFEEPGHKTARRRERADYRLSEEARLDVLATVEGLETPFTGVLDTALEAWGNGHKLQEQVRAVVATDAGEGIRTVAIKGKPHTAYRFAVTRNMDLLGAVPGAGGSLWITSADEFAQASAFVPADALFVLSMRGNDGNPQGKAAKRVCYDAWNRKQRLKPESLRHAALFGSGRISIEGPAPTAQTPMTAPKVNFQGTSYDLVDWLALQAAQLANGSYLILPDGWQLKVHAAQGSGEVFERGFDRCDLEMVMGYLTVTRATLEAQHGSKADSDTAAGLLTELVNYIRAALCEAVRNQIFVPDLALRKGLAFAKRYAPKLLMARAEMADVPALLSALAQARAAGIVTDEQLPFWDRKIGQPERDLAETPGAGTPGSDEERGLSKDGEEEVATFVAGFPLPF